MITLQVEMMNRHGHILRGVVTLPKGIQTPPIVLNLHGFTGNKSGHRSAHTHMARMLAKNGIGCARFDFYGNCESDGEFEDMTFTTLLEDTEDLYAWLTTQSYVDPTKIILSGQSMGGFVAATAAPRVQPYALILMCPGAGMWYGCKERADQIRSTGKEYADIDGLRYNITFNYDMATYHPFEDAKGYHGKVLLIRGTSDVLVDDAICEKYIDLYGENSTFKHVEGGDHNFASLKAREDCEKLILEFLSSF